MARDAEDVWAKRIARWRESGLTAKEFAAEIGVNVHSVWNWSRRFPRVDAPVARRGSRELVPARVEWVEVAAPSTSVAPVSGFEVLLLGGERVVRVPADFDGDALRRLLAVVEAR
jgi:hypothetical protein